MKELKLTLPTSVMVGRKRFYFSLNNYRNAHYQTLNKAKKAYSEIVMILVLEAGKKTFDCAQVSFTYHPSTRRKWDLDNIDSVTRKFVLDALVHCGVLKDDDSSYIHDLSAKVGGIRKTACVDVIIREEEAQIK